MLESNDTNTQFCRASLAPLINSELKKKKKEKKKSGPSPLLILLTKCQSCKWKENVLHEFNGETFL